MKNFTNIVNRLKTELSLTMDKDIAQFLGMTKTAFAERKRRGVFPEEALMLADMKHPELKLDVEYILSGKKGNDFKNFLSQKNKERIANPIDVEDISIEEQPITPKDADAYVLVNMEEKILLNWYRRSDTKGKSLIFDIANMTCNATLAKMRLSEYIEKQDLSYTEKKENK